MGALPKTRMTVDEYLRWSESQGEGRYELVGGEVIMMSPETVRHVAIKNEAWLALRTAIVDAGLACRAYGDGVGILIDDETVREPDITVQCKPADLDSLVLDEPVVVVEVISPSSIRSDTGAKVAEYFRVASVRHYLIIDPFGGSVIKHSRSDADRPILTEIHRSGVIAIDPPGLHVSTESLLGSGANTHLE
jgi:Uma2 family endonuclease